MKAEPLRPSDVVGLLRPAIDAHTLGIASLANLLEDCGYRVLIADRSIADAVNTLQRPGRCSRLLDWVSSSDITRIGLSYRLDPRDAGLFMGRLRSCLISGSLYGERRSQVRGLYFAGLPDACSRVRMLGDASIVVFSGSESDRETLARLGVPEQRMPSQILQASAYDDARLQFGRDLVTSENHRAYPERDHLRYPGVGTSNDRLASRLRAAQGAGRLPLLRAHAGPYDPNRHAALQVFSEWVRDLRDDGHLDILSLGTSQLTQERFGENWAGAPNGGGLPINSENEYREIAQMARPMLVRTYAGTTNIRALAQMHERSLNIAWHALSLWWFSRLDGRGPNPVLMNLREHLATMQHIARSGRPLEANVPHHFAFRGADDVTYVVSGFLAARAAKAQGIRLFVLQVMLNTPRATPGVQDLAKSRALLRLVRRLEDSRFRVILQPRAGLDYLSPDSELARAQLAAATVLMDDIEPNDPTSPPMIHVVSFSEGHALATPPIIKESLRIVRTALERHRRDKASLKSDLVGPPEGVAARTDELEAAASLVIAALDGATAGLDDAVRLYVALASGFLVAPDVWGEAERVEFEFAVGRRTRAVGGEVRVVDEFGRPVDRVLLASEAAANVPTILRRLGIRA